MKFFWEKHSNLYLAESTLIQDGKVGVGLFAKEPIPDGTIICWYWGHLVLSDLTTICDPQSALHSGLDSNILMFPDQPYNPIVKTPTKVKEDDLDRDLHLFMVTSNCCFGSYAKERCNQSMCNARITDVMPPGWVCTDGYRDLNHFQSVIATPILCLLSTRDINKGEEIFVSDLPPRVSCKTREMYQQGKEGGEVVREGSEASESEESDTNLSTESK